MTIGSVSTASTIYDIDPTTQTNQTDGASPLTCPDASSSQVSGPAKWMSELQDLAKSDPDKFKQVTSEIADKLRQEASSATGNQATFLGKLADKFEQASQSGDMSSLQPPSGVSGHHGHHHHVQKYAAQQQGAGTDGSGAPQPVDIAQIIQSSLQNMGVST